MNWRPGSPAAQDGPQALLEQIEKRAKQYLDDADNDKLVYPACKRSSSDARGDQPSICDHTRLEAFRYLLMVPRREFTQLAKPDSQPALLDAYLRQLPHDETVIEFTGDVTADLAISVIAGFNWLNYCAALAGADRRQFSGMLNHFRKIAATAQRWWTTEGAKERCNEMVLARKEPPLLLYLIWADYTRLARQIAAARAAG